jgi:hypothetical protein
MLVAELTGSQLDRWVARANGWTFGPPHKLHEFDVWRDSAGKITGTIPAQAYEPSKNWDQGGPIIESEMIELSHDRDWREDGQFGRVWQGNHAGYGYMDGDTPLIAAMRAYVASKFGAEVQEGSESNG